MPPTKNTKRKKVAVKRKINSKKIKVPVIDLISDKPIKKATKRKKPQPAKDRIIDLEKPVVEKDLAPQPKFFPSIGKANNPLKKSATVDSQTNSQGAKPTNLYRKIAVSFIILTVILLVVIFYFSYISLTIVLIPSQERVSGNLVVDIYDKNKAKSITDQVISGIVEEKEISQSGEYISSGTEKIGEVIIGSVTIINNYTKNQPLVATTRLLTGDNKLFRIKNTINVPAGGSVDVEIYTDEPGETMAIEPTKFTIPGLWAGLQDKIYAQSKEKFIYQKQEKKFILQTDIEAAVKALKEELIKKAKNEIGDGYKGFDQVIYSINENSIVSEVDGKVNEAKDKFSVSLKANINIVAFSQADVSKLINQKFLSIIPDDKELIEYKDKEVVYELNDYNIKQGVASVNVTFEGLMSLKEDAEIIDRNMILGLSRGQLEDYLDSFKEIAGYEIKFSPSVVDKVPSLIDRIKIETRK